MGLLDFFRSKGAAATEARAGDFVGGSAEPDSRREPWCLTLLKRRGTIRLALVAPHGTQEILGIHERLRPLLEKLPHETELHFLCRVADGKHYNVVNLIAVEVCEHASLAKIVRWLDEDFVVARVSLLVARAKERLAAKNEEGALEDLARLADRDIDDFDTLWWRLSPPARQRLLPLYARWLGRRPLSDASTALPLEHWTEEHLVDAATKASADGRPWHDTYSMPQLVDELARRGSAQAGPLRNRAAHLAWLDTMSEPALLLPEQLTRVLATRTREAVAVYADALIERGHPYGEFLSLHLKGTVAATRQAKRLAQEVARTWLGPIAGPAEKVEYELGLPVAMELQWAPGEGEVAAVVAHPMLASFRRILRRKTKKTRRTDVDPDDFLPLVRAALQLSLVEVDCLEGGLTSIADLDLSRVTHLHDLDLLEVGEGPGETGPSLRELLVPAKLRSVQWVELRVNAGQSGRVFDLLQRDSSGFFATLRPHLELFFVGGASEAERARLKALLPRLAARAVTIDGQPVAAS